MFLGPFINDGANGLRLLGHRLLQGTGVLLFPVRLVRVVHRTHHACLCCCVPVLLVLVSLLSVLLLPVLVRVVLTPWLLLCTWHCEASARRLVGPVQRVALRQPCCGLRVDAHRSRRRQGDGSHAGAPSAATEAAGASAFGDGCDSVPDAPAQPLLQR